MGKCIILHFIILKYEMTKMNFDTLPYLHIPGHTRSLSGSILRHKISLKSAILYPFIP